MLHTFLISKCLLTYIEIQFLSNENGEIKMASAVSEKKMLITDLRARDDESIYKRIEKLSINAKKIHSNNEFNAQPLHSNYVSIDEHLRQQKIKILEKALLQIGSQRF